MKSLKINHQFVADILSGKRKTTWRINDDKDLHVNDRVQLIDKKDPSDPSTWQPIGIIIIESILEKQLGKVTEQDLEEGQHYDSMDDILEEYRGYYGQQVVLETPVKIIRFSFSAGDNQPQDSTVTHAKLFADGGSRGNPGPSASGFVLLNEHNEVVEEKGVFLGVTTNNQAEYQSLKFGLTAALKRGIRSLDVYMDSMLVVNQIKGVYKVKNADLRAVYSSAMDLIAKFESVRITHVPRERNKKADALVNEALDASSKAK